MSTSFLKRLATPDDVGEDAVIAAGFGLAFLISFIDFTTGSGIQLHFLYIFPIALV